jgi:epoxide hydrolase 4
MKSSIALVLLSVLVGCAAESGDEVAEAPVEAVEADETAAASIGHTDVQIRNDVKLHVRSAGRKGAPLMLFLHGWPEYSGKWDTYLRSFGNDYYAVAPDMRGFDRSSKPGVALTNGEVRVAPGASDNYRLDTLAEDISLLVQKLGYSSCVLVAHDWGGMVAYYVTERYESLVDKLVVMNAPHPKYYAMLYADQTSAQRKAAAYVDDLISPDARFKLSFFGHFALKRAIFHESIHTFTSAEKAGYVESWKQDQGSSSTLAASALYYTDYVRNLHARTASMKGFSQTPTLLFWGKSDKGVLLDNVNGIKKCVGNMQPVVYFDDATHWISHEKTAQIVPAIRRFAADPAIVKGAARTLPECEAINVP